jgi:hypothetical protein
MPPHGWTPEELSARKIHAQATSDGSLKDLSVTQFGETLQARTGVTQAGWGGEMAVNLARAEGNFGQRMMERGVVTKRAKSKWGDKPMPAANRTARQVASAEAAEERTRAAISRFQSKS